MADSGTDTKTNSKRKKRGKRIGIAAGVVVAVFFVASFFVDRAMLGQTYERHDRVGPNLLLSFEDYKGAYSRKPVSFQVGDSTLRGYVYGPENTRGLIIFRHGIFSHHQEYLPFIVAMVDRGWRVFAYDAIGCGESDGDNVVGMSQSMRDVAEAVAFARESGLADGMKVGLWGHSWGGYGVAAALGRTEDVDACVTMSGFDTPMKILNDTAGRMVGPIAVTQTPTMWLNSVLAFGGDADVSASRAIADSGVPTLVIHGTGDTVVPYDDVSILDNVRQSGVVPQNVSTMTLDDPGRDGHNDYFYSRESQQYLNECSAELARLLEASDGDADAPEVQAYIASVDKLRANTANPELIGEIDAFFAQHLEGERR